MAKCDQGYLCEVCGEEVEDLSESDLYLRFIIGEVPVRDLLTSPERHLKCHPFLAQFILDDRFEPVKLDSPFSKENLDPAERSRMEALVTRGFQRLQELRTLPPMPFAHYPLPEFQTAG
ncbi:conserved hypothetical protein [Planctopirus limnophila DSM 3776]|uniref:Uncharacterized protein n=1 Tax=Planctopirus limnophila (strain ATCC 43296 / DSM 3776 / IFAM 1008 / Mu 290) TaxID=521674 RepID=D5SNW0_PLAL2|nr:hypothetical protein [Planctopirus limnophila]ADG66115.1 conserved hypothetical protein [Planctopirus limnophila DSM 3776]